MSPAQKRLKGALDNILRSYRDEGAILVDGSGARVVELDTEADLTLTADAEVFLALESGEENPQMAFMSGKLQLDGDMALAMRLDSILN